VRRQQVGVDARAQLTFAAHRIEGHEQQGFQKPFGWSGYV
jgi:hypothetical protein